MQKTSNKQTKYIIITGGVLSGLGKGVVSASIGKLLTDSYKVIPVKCDGYLNVDPGTMNPTEHGEVFVLKDGGEVDLDFGHYERFLSVECKQEWSLTSGKIFLSLMERERKGDFLGKTVQIIPHVTGQIRQTLQGIAQQEQADVVLVEIGGTVGDIENLWFLEAVRELVREVGKQHVLFVHLGLIPVLDEQGEQKTKPMQQSLTFLRERSIFPDVLIGRSKQVLHEKTRQKLHWLCNVEQQAIISDPDTTNIYELPLIFEQEGLLQVLNKKLGLQAHAKIDKWKALLQKPLMRTLTIGVCGKYTTLSDSYISISHACLHAGLQVGAQVNIVWIDAETWNPQDIQACDGLIIPGGFGTRGIEGKIKISTYARQHHIPLLGICYGLQLMVIDIARHLAGLHDAHTTEVDIHTAHPVVDILPEQKTVTQKGASMRLGGYHAYLQKDSLVYTLYKKEKVNERHRHRYEVNPAYHDALQKAGLVLSGLSANKQLVEFIELPTHPFFVGTQAHPELQSSLDTPAPLFVGLLQACMKK
ncbi:MAG: CTP synthase [Candidatus Woesearchaeota archaeon]